MAKLKDDDPRKDIHLWAKQMLEDAEEYRRPHESQWWENLATYAGDLWSEWDPRNKRLDERIPQAEHRVRIPINLAQPVVRTELAKLMKNKPIINAIARSNDKTDLNAAKVGDSMLNEYAERQFHLPKVRRKALMWVLTCGLGGVFVDYDERALGDQEVLVDPKGVPVFDQRMVAAIQRHYRDKHKAPKTMKVPIGELLVKSLSPFQLVWDLSQLEFEDAMWCIVSDVYDCDEVWRRWDADVEPQDDALPGVMERRLLAKSDLTGKMKMGSVKNQRLVRVNRLFVRPGHRYFPDGLHLVFTDDEVIKEENFPFDHGELPVSVMGHVPMPVSQYAMSTLAQVRGPVLEISKTVSQLIENRNLMANIPWVEYEQNRIEGEIQNKPGMRLTVWYQPGVPDPHPVEMPEMPAYVQNLVPTMKEFVLEISGQGETSQGKVPAGARSGVAIAYLQEEDDTRLGPTVQEFEEMNERFSGHLLNGFAQFYDAPRTIHIYRGANSEPEVFDFIGTQLLGVAGVVCQAGSALPRSKAAKQQFILDLYDRGLEQDPRKIREMLELSQGEPDEWEVDMQQADRENRRLMKGEPVPVMEWHNHPAHHYRHRHFMKSEDFENLPREVQQAFIDHDNEHSNFERQQKQQLMVDGLVTGNGAGGNGGPPAPGGQQEQIPLTVGNGQQQQTAPAQFTSPDGVGNLIEGSPQ